MPIYVYECQKCQKQFEIEQRITADALTTCLCDKSGAVKRVIQPVGISFVGSGFHINDYSGGGSEPSSEPAKSETPAPAPASEPTTSSE